MVVVLDCVEAWLSTELSCGDCGARSIHEVEHKLEAMQRV
jgi:hypothetical protein